MSPSSPIDSLPFELLVLIFAYARDLSSTRSNVLFAVMEVSRLWRHVALGTPLLFATIVHRTWATMLWPWPGETQSGRTPDAIRDLHRFLKFSGDAPLTYYLAEGNSMLHNGREDTIPLLKNAHRWKDVQFVVPNTDVERLGGYAFPMLERLYIDACFTPPSAWARGLFADATQLRVVRFSFVKRPTEYDLPWARLTECETNTPQIEEVVGVLERATGLKRFRWDGFGESEKIEVMERMKRVHEGLEHLVVVDNTLLRCVDMPGLKTLEWICRGGRMPDDVFLQGLRIPKVKIRLA